MWDRIKYRTIFAVIISLTIPIILGQLTQFRDHYYNTQDKINSDQNVNPSQPSGRETSGDQYKYNYNDRGQPNDRYRGGGGQYNQQDYGRTNPNDYYANGTHRIFGNVSEFYSPNVYGRNNPANPSAGGNPNLNVGGGVNQNYGGGGVNQNYGGNNGGGVNQYYGGNNGGGVNQNYAGNSGGGVNQNYGGNNGGGVNQNNGAGVSRDNSRQRNYVTPPPVQDVQSRGFDNYGGRNQNPATAGFPDNNVNVLDSERGRSPSPSVNSPNSNRGSGDVVYQYPSGGIPPQQQPQSQQQQPNIDWGNTINRGNSDYKAAPGTGSNTPSRSASDFQGNSGYQGRPGYEGSHGFGPTPPRGTSSRERDQGTSQSQNPFNKYNQNQYQQTVRPNPEVPFYGSNYKSGYSGGGGTYDSRGVFDPGYPNRNIWNEHWSTTTLRPTAPGVLGKWRPDLQGQQRPEDIHQVPQSVYATTTYGRIQGFKVKLYDGPWVPLPARPGVANVDKVKNHLYSFVGIPYARPPVLEGRFRPPRPHTGWQLHQAVEFGPACPQPLRFFGYEEGLTQVDEDCLYLNVYSPDIGSGVEGSPYPVVFYIHDGDFVHGGSQTFPPHQLVAWYKLVVVTVNFRLGALGFLSTADEFSPGNYGMLDLSMALKWVHENIRSFNGDPDRITLLGLGSGAAAAGLLMLVPRTRLFVKNVIALDGAPTAEWAAITDEYRLQNTTQLFSFKVGCWNEYDTTSWSMVQCLRTRSWQELANLELDPDVGVFPWSPAVDRRFKVPMDDYEHDWREEDWRFLPDAPENILRSGDYPQIKYMTGFSRQSAADMLYNNKSLAPNYEITRAWFDEQINLWVKKYNYTLNPEGVFNAIRYAYTYWPDPLNTTHLREEYIQFLSDALYRAPVDQTIKLLLARGVQVHTYLLNYTLEGLRLPEWREVNRGLNYYMLTGAPFMDPEFLPERLRVDRKVWTEGDRNMSLFLMTAVANMSYYGNPTHEEILGLYWYRSTPADLKYFSLNGTNNSTMDRNYRQRELTFWTEYMPYVVGKYVPTYPPTTEYWWEPTESLQIAFWTVSGICLILIVVLVSCCLLWRNAKMQRDRIYDDLGLRSGPNIGTIVGDEISEYAETVKTMDSMDSTLKLPQGHHSNPPIDMRLYQPQIHTNQGAISQPSLAPSSRDRDRFPTPKRTATPQTQV